MKILLTPFLVVLLLAPSAWSAKKPAYTYWKESGFNFSHLNFDDQLCRSELNEFRRCLAGLEALAENLEPALSLDRNQKGKVLMGGLSFREAHPETQQKAKAPEVNSPMHYQLLRDEARQRLVQEQRLFSEMKDGQYQFRSTANEFIARIKANPRLTQLQEMLAGVVQETMLIVQDAHASIYPIAMLAEESSGESEIFYGIGIDLLVVKGFPHVRAIKSGGPAHSSGLLQVNDLILRIDGKSTQNISLERTAELIRGAKDTSVSLQIQRMNEILEVQIPRGPLEFKNLNVEVAQDLGQKFGLIQLSTFMDDTACTKIADEIRKFEAGKVKGYILDLRGNGGGHLVQARCIAGLFFGNRVVVGTRSLASRQIDWLRAVHPYEELTGPAIWNFSGFVVDERPWYAEALTDKPIAVLIDGHSASASEIVAGAIQDHGRGWIVGERSFGKGTVQTLLPDQVEGARVYVGRTTARFYLPSGRTNQLVGIQPDFEIPFKPDATESERFVAREADQFPHALVSEKSEWKQPRQSQVDKIQSCLQSGSAKRRAQELLKNGEKGDFQYLSAQEVLLCEQVP